MSYYQQQQNSFYTAGATTGDFPPSVTSNLPSQFQFFFAGGVPAPSSGIYELTPASPGGLSSLGSQVTFEY